MHLAFSGLSSRSEEDSALVFSSALLAGAASHTFTLEQTQRGLSTWQRPGIFSIDAWLTSRWQEARYGSSNIPALLSPVQETLLWKQIIEADQPRLFDSNATARLARKTAALIAEWRMPLDAAAWDDYHDARQFRNWYATFRRMGQERGWISRSDLWHSVPDWISKGVCTPEPSIFAGFDEITPALKLLSSSFLSADLQLVHGAIATEFGDLREQIDWAARYARARFEENPQRSIAVFVPELPVNRTLVERVFQQVFYPASALRISAPAVTSVFHLNAAMSLLDHPIVASAMLLLEIANAPVPQTEVSATLLCPFIAGAAMERNARALADLELRSRRQADVTIWDLERVSRNCPRLSTVWPRLRELLQSTNRGRELPAWAEFFGDVLEAFGWPGDAELTASEQETVEAWNETLSTLGSLGLISPSASLEAALSHLRRLLAIGGVERGDWFSPVQIFDLTSAAGLRFDSAIVTGLSDEAWPPRISPYPLVPFGLQRAYGVPQTDPQWLLAHHSHLTHALFAAAPELAVTYSGRLSPFAEPLVADSKITSAVWMGRAGAQSFSPVRLEEIQDTTAPAFDTGREVRGGTSIIKLQSLCPFRAFAEIRLRASLPEESCLGFDARDRGGFVHKALQLVWQELRTQSRLLDCSADQLRDIINNSVLRAVETHSDSGFHDLVSQVERERLEGLILDWLTTIETQRTQPFCVETVESEFQYNLSGLPLRLRVDRIDRLRNGAALLVDYKSGKQTRGKLECPRPAEPQLLVYAASRGQEVEGILFGEIRPREMRMVGITRDKHLKRATSITAKGSEWIEFLEEARTEMERLATEFLSGYAAVDPIANACEYCAIKPLCRVQERGMQEDAAE